MSMANLKIDPMRFAQIRASTLHAKLDLRTETRSIRPPNPDEVQVAIRTTTLCGSDLHYYHDFRNGDIQVLEPLTLGHESAGIVTAVGSSHSRLQKGDKVALEVGLPCGNSTCELCQEGRYNICPQMRFRSSARGFPHAQGTLQEKLNHPVRFVHKLPHELSLEMGALLEPLSVAIHASRRASLKPGAKVLVFGAGAVGLLVAAVIRMNDAQAKVVIADVDKGRVGFARENGFAQAGFMVSRPERVQFGEHLSSAQAMAEEIGELELEGEGLGQVDAVFECTGVMSCLQTAIYATKSGGKVMLVGMGTPVQTLPISAAALREVDIVGVFRYRDTYPAGVELLQRMQVALEQGKDVPRIDKLVTHRYRGFENVEEAFKMAARTVDDHGKLVLKVMVEFGGEDTRAKL